MAHKWADRVLETATTTGTGDFTLAGNVAGFQRFSAACSTGDTVYYDIEGVDANGVPTGEWETGLGTYSASNTLTRTTVIASSNSGAAVNFSGGTKRVCMPPPAKTAAGVHLISETTTSGSQASVTFSTIPTHFRDLILRVRGRGTASAASGGVILRLNGDSGANYDYEQIESFAAGSDINQYVGQTGFRAGLLPQATATSGRAGQLTATIADYNGTTFAKSIMSQFSAFTGTGGFSIGAGIYGGGWRTASAVTSVAALWESGNFVDGSIVSLYGSF